MKTIFLQKKFLALKFLIITLMSCTTLLNANASNIAILDLEKIIKDSKAMRDIQNKVNKKQDEYQKEVSKKQNDLETEQKTIEAKKQISLKMDLKKKYKNLRKKLMI